MDGDGYQLLLMHGGASSLRLRWVSSSTAAKQTLWFLRLLSNVACCFTRNRLSELLCRQNIQIYRHNTHTHQALTYLSCSCHGKFSKACVLTINKKTTKRLFKWKRSQLIHYCNSIYWEQLPLISHYFSTLPPRFHSQMWNTHDHFPQRKDLHFYLIQLANSGTYLKEFVGHR